MHRRPPLPVLVALVGIGAYWCLSAPAAVPDETDAMLGTWTDEGGLPGNSIRFYLVPVDLEGGPLVTGLEGHLTATDFLGHKAMKGQWNYGSFDPLVVNVLLGKEAWYLVIAKLDDEHLLVRFGTDPAEIMRPTALDHPDTRTLTRIGWE